MHPPLIHPPPSEELLGPLLASLPAASISARPPTALLPLLSPILRQRVQLLSEASNDPWLPLLCYNPSHVSKLEAVVKNERFEPHPVSGEVEVDWESELEHQYKRLDEETLQALVTLRDLDLAVQLIYCVNDEIGGGSGWRIGEVTVLDPSTSSWGGHPSITAAESAARAPRAFIPADGRLPTLDVEKEEDEEEDDDDYWAQYDNTPARTPAPNGPATALPLARDGDAASDEDSYYAQYASVQPAMDSHDPDEVQQNGEVETSLGRDEIAAELQNHVSQNDALHNSSAVWSNDSHLVTYTPPTGQSEFVRHPRPSSSHGSSGSDTVARLEQKVAAAEDDGHEHDESERAVNPDAGNSTSEVGIKQHIGTSIKSLWRLAKVAGIERQEFERVVRIELECIATLDEDGD